MTSIPFLASDCWHLHLAHFIFFSRWLSNTCSLQTGHLSGHHNFEFIDLMPFSLRQVSSRLFSRLHTLPRSANMMTRIACSVLHVLHVHHGNQHFALTGFISFLTFISSTQFGQWLILIPQAPDTPPTAPSSSSTLRFASSSHAGMTFCFSFRFATNTSMMIIKHIISNFQSYIYAMADEALVQCLIGFSLFVYLVSFIPSSPANTLSR
jgi:hypothetical protein